MSQVLPGQGHTEQDCACCHADTDHKTFGEGTGSSVLCQGCMIENWESLRAAAEKAVQLAREAVEANPGSGAHALMLEMVEPTLELFKSREGETWDMARLDAAGKRLEAAYKAIAALTTDPKGNA